MVKIENTQTDSIQTEFSKAEPQGLFYHEFSESFAVFSRGDDDAGKHCRIIFTNIIRDFAITEEYIAVTKDKRI